MNQPSVVSPDSQNGTDDLSGLLERLKQAQHTLLMMAATIDSEAHPLRCHHLRSKAEGVGLALSYLNEELRLRAGVS